MRFEIMAKEKEEKSSKKKSKKEKEKELNSKVDELIEKNFEDFKSQDEIEDFIQKAFDEKTSSFNKNFELKQKELDKQIKKTTTGSDKRFDRKMREMDKKIKNHYKNMVK